MLRSWELPGESTLNEVISSGSQIASSLRARTAKPDQAGTRDLRRGHRGRRRRADCKTQKNDPSAHVEIPSAPCSAALDRKGLEHSKSILRTSAGADRCSPWSVMREHFWPCDPITPIHDTFRDVIRHAASNCIGSRCIGRVVGPAETRNMGGHGPMTALWHDGRTSAKRLATVGRLTLSSRGGCMAAEPSSDATRAFISELGGPD